MSTTHSTRLPENTVAFVTGAGRGIGRAIACAVAEAGATVAVAEVNAEGAAETVKAIDAMGGSALAVGTDVRSQESVEEACAVVERELGPITVLINNAGTITIKPFLDTTPDEWDLDIRTCLYGTLHTCRAIAPGMVERGNGVIINIGSDAGRAGEHSHGAYAAAKGGVIAFTKTLARELGPKGVRVNCVCPGATRTPMLEPLLAANPNLAKRYPLRRIGEPEDVAATVVFLASPAAQYITGQTLSVDGGYLMC